MIEIKDLSGNVKYSTPINKGSKRRFLLMKEDYIVLKFSEKQPYYFQLGDGIDNEFGIFELVDLYKPVFNPETAGYDYELRLDAYYWKWKNKKFFYSPEFGGREASWNLTAPLDTHLGVLLKNLEVLGYKFRGNNFMPDVANTVEKSSKLISYNNCNLIDALTQMAETWECDWWITENYIHFGRCEYNKEYPVDFEINENVSTMERSDSQSTYATRIYAFGSTRNIPPTYRKNLIFDVKDVNGLRISDTTRTLDSKFFPKDSLLPKDRDFFHSSTKYNNGTTAIKLESSAYARMNNNEILPRGNYIVRIESLKISCTANSGQPSNFVNRVSLTLGDKTQIIVDETIVTANFKLLAMQDKVIKVEVPRNIFSCDFNLYASIDKCLSGGSIVFYLKGTFENEIKGASASVTFISGLYKGQSFSAVYNPDLKIGKESNILEFSDRVFASAGDRYTIDNIIRNKVPANYFSNDGDEQAVNGVVQKRLMLPEDTPYIDAEEHMPQEEAIEEIVVFDDVYPKYTGTVSETSFILMTESDVEQSSMGKKYPIWSIRDKNLKSFSMSYRLDEFRIVFQTGKLSGLDFAVDFIKCDDNGTTFKIIRNDDYGRFLPDDILFPQTTHTRGDETILADTYILYGFDTAYMSESMLPNAEVELKEKAQKYVERSKIDPSTYNCRMLPSGIYRDGKTKTYEIGECVRLINSAYFEKEGRISRIIGYECSLDIDHDYPIYIVGETAAYSRLGEIESKINSLTYKGQTYTGTGSSSGGSGVYVIGLNDKTLPSNRNVFSSKKSLNSFLNKAEDGSTTGHITFENGILVRKQEIVEASPMALIEENDAIVEEIKLSQETGTTTLGALENVSDEADDISDTNDIIVRLAGSSEWSVNNTVFSDVAQLMETVFPFSLSLSGGGVYEKGSTQLITLTWSYDRDITSQSINGTLELIDTRSKQFEGVATDAVYTLSAVYNGKSHSKSVSASFRLKKYFGVSEHDELTNEEILALSTSWAERMQMVTEFDCTGGKYPYYILPTSMVNGIQFWIGGLRNTDWLQEVREVTNGSGHTESYTIFRLNGIQTGVLNIEVK